MTTSSEQEINLWEVLQKTSRWCFQKARIFLIFLLKKSIWITCFIFAGIAVGGVLYLLSKPYYSANMLVRANVADNFFYVSLINTNLAPENISSLHQASLKLNIPEDIVEQIKSVRACYAVDLNKDGLPDAIDEKNKYIFSEDSSQAAKILLGSFYINTQVYSPEALPYIRRSVMDIIDKNSYIQRLNARRLEEINQQISYLHQQQYRFDSLQQYEYFQKERDKKRVGNGQLLILNEQSQQLYHNELISLNNRILENNTVLQLYSDPITIIQEFSETPGRKNSLIFYAIPFIIAFLLGGLLFLIIRDNRKTLVRLYREKILNNE